MGMASKDCHLTIETHQICPTSAMDTLWWVSFKYVLGLNQISEFKYRLLLYISPTCLVFQTISKSTIHHVYMTPEN